MRHRKLTVEQENELHHLLELRAGLRDEVLCQRFGISRSMLRFYNVSRESTQKVSIEECLRELRA